MDGNFIILQCCMGDQCTVEIECQVHTCAVIDKVLVKNETGITVIPVTANRRLTKMALTLL